MMHNQVIQIKDRKFALSIPEHQIHTAVQTVGEQINIEFAGKNPLFVVILNGAFMFAADLLKCISIPCEITFMKFSSYDGTSTSGTATEIKGINESLQGRNVIIVEDIVDTGITMEHVLASVHQMGAKSVTVATLLQKPEALQRDVKVDYVALKIPNDFIVGYGLDYDGYGRNLKDIYTVMD
jgi:hypoxanthine phosphoribosyltransferase